MFNWKPQQGVAERALGGGSGGNSSPSDYVARQQARRAPQGPTGQGGAPVFGGNSGLRSRAIAGAGPRQRSIFGGGGPINPGTGRETRRSSRWDKLEGGWNGADDQELFNNRSQYSNAQGTPEWERLMQMSMSGGGEALSQAYANRDQAGPITPAATPAAPDVPPQAQGWGDESRGGFGGLASAYGGQGPKPNNMNTQFNPFNQNRVNWGAGV